MNRIAATFAFAVLAGIVCASCDFLPSEPYREVKSYDLGIPPSAGELLTVQPFNADSACKFKLLYRAGGNEMLIDEYNKWTQPPGQMLTKHLRLAFRGEPASDGKPPKMASAELSGSILAFEADLDSMKAQLGVHYALTPLKNGENAAPVERTAIFEEPLAAKTPDAIAAAMTKAAAQLVQSIKSDAKALAARQAATK